ncbi:MAG: OmpA family protein [bacterium]
MKQFKLNNLLGPQSVLLLGTLLASTQLQAFNYQQYSRSFSLVFDKIEDARLDESYVNSNSDFLYNLGVSYVDSPLVAKTGNFSTQTKSLIENMTSLNLGMASYITPWFMLGANTSYTYFKDNNGVVASGFNDVQLMTKFRVMNERRWAMSVIPFMTIPTAGALYNVKNSGIASLEGQQINVLSDQDFGFGVKFATEFLTRYIQFAANVGYKFNERAVVYYNNGSRANDMTQQLSTGFGAYVPLHKSFGFSAEYMRLWSNPLFSSKINPNEFMFAASAGLSESLNGFLGVAVGNLITHDDGNDYRVTVGLKVAPCVWGVVCKKDKVETVSQVEAVEKVEEPKEVLQEQKNKTSGFSGEEVISSELLGDVVVPSVEDSKMSGSSDVTYVVRYPQNIAFISMKDRARLKKVLTSVKADLATIKAIRIVGHASAEGETSVNKQISHTRAVMMKDELLKLGIPSSKIEMGYFGSDQPSEADIPANRRVELQIVR